MHLRTTTIPLALALLTGSSDRPGGIGRAVLERLPIWSCSVRGFACHPCCHGRGALLPHLFTLTSRLTPPGFARGKPVAPLPDPHDLDLHGPALSEPSTGLFYRAPKGRVEGRYIFCATFLRVAPTGGYPAHCPAEFGLSSPPARSVVAEARYRAAEAAVV
jgi:hypothetical protein